MKIRTPTIIEVLVIVAIFAILIALLQPVTRGTLSPFFAAVARGDVAEVQKLIDSGRADPNELGRHGRKPLHYAAYYDREDVAKLLLEKGAEINTANRYGETPLHSAASLGSIKVVRLLVDRGANVSAADSGGKTPLDRAEEAAQTIADCDRDKTNNRIIDDAERKKYADVVNFLIDKGAKRSSTLKDRR